MPLEYKTGADKFLHGQTSLSNVPLPGSVVFGFINKRAYEPHYTSAGRKTHHHRGIKALPLIEKRMITGNCTHSLGINRSSQHVLAYSRRFLRSEDNHCSTNGDYKLLPKSLIVDTAL